MNPYMQKTEAMLREGKAKLERLRVAAAGKRVEKLETHRHLRELESRYEEASDRFDELRTARTGIPDLKVQLEHAWSAFERALQQ